MSWCEWSTPSGPSRGGSRTRTLGEFPRARVGSLPRKRQQLLPVAPAPTFHGRRNAGSARGRLKSSDKEPSLQRPIIAHCLRHRTGGYMGGTGKTARSCRRPHIQSQTCVSVGSGVWRADFRLRWVIHSFRGGPQSGCHHLVSSPRHIERSVRVSSHYAHLLASCRGL
jgi:hypothetical protein